MQDDDDLLDVRDTDGAVQSDRTMIAPLMRPILVLVLVVGVPAAAGELVIPHRQARISVDGRLGDWRGQGVTVRFADPDPGGDPNRVWVSLAWERNWLYAAFRVTDGTIVPPPRGVRPAGLYQGDAVELYLDGDARGGAMMNGNDYQFIVSCDGRKAILQGEPVLARLKAFSVPKIERRTPGFRAVARPTAGGYVVELAVPLPAILTAEPQDGSRIGLDLAVDDWDEVHPAVDETSMDEMIEAARRVLREDAPEGEIDPFHVAMGLGYRPWSLCSGRDFGYPSVWRTAVLRGRPPWIERTAERFGLVRLLLLSIALVTAAWLSLLVLLEIRHRHRVHALLERLARLDRKEEAADSGERTPHHIAVALAGTEDEISDPVVARALALVRERTNQVLSPGGLASELNVSLRTLQRALAQELGCTPRELILGVKMHSARKMLASGRVRVGEAAARVGFTDPAHFSRRYRAYFGHPPSADRPGQGAS